MVAGGTTGRCSKKTGIQATVCSNLIIGEYTVDRRARAVFWSTSIRSSPLPLPREPWLRLPSLVLSMVVSIFRIHQRRASLISDARWPDGGEADLRYTTGSLAREEQAGSKPPSRNGQNPDTLIVRLRDALSLGGSRNAGLLPMGSVESPMTGCKGGVPPDRVVGEKKVVA